MPVGTKAARTGLGEEELGWAYLLEERGHLVALSPELVDQVGVDRPVPRPRLRPLQPRLQRRDGLLLLHGQPLVALDVDGRDVRELLGLVELALHALELVHHLLVVHLRRVQRLPQLLLRSHEPKRVSGYAPSARGDDCGVRTRSWPDCWSMLRSWASSCSWPLAAANAPDTCPSPPPSPPKPPTCPPSDQASVRTAAGAGCGSVSSRKSVETIGGCDVARDLVLRAIDNGKHVITANKALIAEHGSELFERAAARGVTVSFEAAVAGGIPIVKAIREGLAANRIEWLAGIINGTGNFILSEMREKGRPFDDVLAEAQQLGYAEADPTFDVEGIDAAHKLVILASISFGIPLQFDKVFTEGISAIDLQDVSYAEELGYRIKHLGIARRNERGIELRVHPTLIPEQRLLANVNGVMNAVLVEGDAAGPTLYYGAGAGGEPTASAVVADIIDVARGLDNPLDSRVPYLAFQPGALSPDPILAIADVETSFYLRMEVLDQLGVLSKVAQIMSDAGISIEALIQKEPQPGASTVPLILLTNRVREGLLMEAVAAIEALESVTGSVIRLRVESLDG